MCDAFTVHLVEAAFLLKHTLGFFLAAMWESPRDMVAA